MEDWQREHIRKNFVGLLETTECNTLLIASLTSAQLLSPCDAEVLGIPSLTRTEKSKKLYDILQSRVGAYNILINSLESTRQSGAVRILRQHPQAPKPCQDIHTSSEANAISNECGREQQPRSESSWDIMNHIRHNPVARTFNNWLGSNITSIYNRSDYDIMVVTTAQPTTLDFTISNGRIQLNSGSCLQRAHVAEGNEFRFSRKNSVDYLTVAMNQNGKLLETTNFRIIANVSYKIGNDCIPREVDYNKTN